MKYPDFVIEPIDTALSEYLQEKIDLKTKPLGSLGLLEELALQIGLIQQTLSPQLIKPTLVVYAGDHGLAEEGISSFPQEVTAQMVRNYVKGGAAVSVFCRENNVSLVVVDAGIAGDVSDLKHKITDHKVAPGTKNMLTSAAMTPKELKTALTAGANVVESLHTLGVNVTGLGEMGIGNSSSAALIYSYLTNLPLDMTVERGAGCSDDGLHKKRQILQEVKDYHGGLKDAYEVMRHVGGFELAMALGHILKACELKMVVLIDGYIMTAVALAATKLYPAALNYMIFCHRSSSPSHTLILTRLGVRPVLDLSMRLGEGSGVAVAYPVIKSAVQFLNEMASFESAQVATSSR